VKQKVIDDFDKMYALNCDNKEMNKRQRGFSKDNPFDQHNKPPVEHIIPENILEKPGRIINLNLMKD